MTVAERRWLKVWLALCVLAAIPMFLGWILILLIFTGLGVPVALLLGIMPTLWLYATAASLLYVALRLALRRFDFSRKRLASLAAAMAIAVGVAIPSFANKAVDRRVSEIMADDMGREPLLAPVRSVAIFNDAGMGPPEGKCWDECQRLLFSGFADTVLHGSLGTLSSRRAAGPPLVRHRIVPVEEGCDNAMLMATFAARADWSGPPPPPYLWEKLDALARQGKCFRSDRTRDPAADLYLVSNWNFDPRRGTVRTGFNPTLRPIEPFRRREIFVRRGGRLVPLMRRTELRFARLAVPLRVSPPFEFDAYEPGHWSYGPWEQVGTGPTYDEMMGHWLRNDLRIRGLGTKRGPDNVVKAPGAKPGANNGRDTSR